MKNIKAFALTLVCALLTFSACNDKDSAKAYTALVTYEAENGNARLQLNDSTVLIPSGLKPDKDTVVRALVNFSFTDDLGIMHFLIKDFLPPGILRLSIKYFLPPSYSSVRPV